MKQWYLYSEGQQRGPVSDTEMRTLMAQGRVEPTDLVWAEGMPDWVPVQNSELMGGAASSPQPGGGGGRGGATPPFASAPYPSPYGRPRSRGYVRPHRGGAVLALGILGLVVCFICGIIAWAMGSADLREMRAGRMDRSGEGLTNAGKICGIVATILAVVGLVIGLIAAAAGVGDMRHVWR